MPIVAEHRPQYGGGGFRFDGAVEFVIQVGGGEMHLAVGAVRRGRHGGRIGGPHARRRTERRQQARRLTHRLRQHRLIAAAEATQHRQMRAFLRRQYPLLETEIGQRLHFQQALFRRQLRVRYAVLMLRRRLVAERQPGIVVRRPHQTVEIDFIS